MTEYQWFAVRDAENPRKIFGFIRLAVNTNSYVLPIAKPLLSSVTSVVGPAIMTDVSFDRIEIKIGIMGDGPTRERAVTSEGCTIAFWRTVKGFVEAQITEPPPRPREVKKPKNRKLPFLEVDL